MSSYKLEKEEKLLQEMMVKYGKNSVDTQLILTNKHIVFEQEKGLFKKKYRVIDKISFEDIKVYNDDDVQVKQDNRQITIQSAKGNVSFLCNNHLDAMKIKEKIVNAKTGKNAYERAEIKLKNWQKKTFIGFLVSVGAKAAWEHREKIFDAAKTLFIKRK